MIDFIRGAQVKARKQKEKRGAIAGNDIFSNSASGTIKNDNDKE